VKNFRRRFLWGIVCIIFLAVSPFAMAGGDYDGNVSIALDGSQNSDDRITAIKELGASGDQLAADPLIVLLKDPREQRAIRSAAVRALAQLGEPRAEIIEALEYAYREPDTERNLSYTILLYLGHMKATKAFSLFENALTHENSTLRFKAAQGLGMLHDDEALRLLIEYMGSEQDRMVRAEMIRALGQTHTALTEAPLINALGSDPEPLVRMNAALMLGQFESLSDDARVALNTSRDDLSPAVRKTVKGILP